MKLLNRIYNLIKGFLSLFVSGVEKKNPAIAYENAINSYSQKYIELRTATAAIVSRQKELNELLDKQREELRVINDNLKLCIQQNKDEDAITLIQRKEVVERSLAELVKDLNEIDVDVAAAKDSMENIKTQVNNLKHERDTAIAKLKSAEARLAVQEQLQGISITAETKALEAARDNIRHKTAEAKLESEMSSNSMDRLAKDGARERAREQLEALKAQQNPSLNVAANIKTHAAPTKELLPE